MKHNEFKNIIMKEFPELHQYIIGVVSNRSSLHEIFYYQKIRDMFNISEIDLLTMSDCRERVINCLREIGKEMILLRLL